MRRAFGWIGFRVYKVVPALAVAVLGYGIISPTGAQASCDHRANLAAFLPFSQTAPFSVTEAAATGSGLRSASIVGLWHVLLVSGGLPFDEGFDAWHSDGTEVLNDTAPPQPANGAGTVCLGVYKKIGPHTYKLKHPFWSFDANANLVGSGVLSEVVTLDPGGTSYHGTFTFNLFDLNKNLIFEATGDLTAERITPD